MRSPFSAEYALVIDALIKARTDAHVTQQELAARLSKPQSFVSKYERKERRIDVVEFIWIAQAIDIDPVRLLKQVTKRLKELPEGR